MPPLTQKRLVELLPHAQLQLLPSAGHAVWVECPGALATALRHALPACL
jgi:pimeloyl-ACP methyl ester carboxylesterase